MIIEEYSLFINSLSLRLNLCTKTGQFFESIRSPHINSFKIVDLLNQSCIGNDILICFFGNIFDLLFLLFDIVFT